MIDCQPLRAQVIRIAREAGETIMRFYGADQPLYVQHKADTSPVTDADLAAHRLICASLQRLTPEFPVLSEESAPDTDRHRWRRYWLVDPLDGTKEFIKRNGEFTVNIALIDDGEPVLGVVYAPVNGVTYSSCRGQGAFKENGNGRQQRIHARPFNRYRPLEVVVSRSHLDPRVAERLEPLRQLLPLSTTAIGSSLKLCLIAEGMADLHLRLGPTSEWDTGAAQAILEAAGGRVSDLQMRPLRYNQHPDTLINPDFFACADPSFDWATYLYSPDTP